MSGNTGGDQAKKVRSHCVGLYTFVTNPFRAYQVKYRRVAAKVNHYIVLGAAALIF